MKDIGLVIIFIVALLPRLIFAFTGNAVLTGDDIDYEDIGRSLYSGAGYLLKGQPTATICPVYPLFIAMVYHIFGPEFAPVRVGSAIFDALMCAAIYLLGRTLFNKRIGYLAGILCAAHYFFLKTIQILRPDTMQMFFIAVSVLSWVRWRKYFLRRDIVILALSFLFAIMLKPSIVPIPALFIAIETYEFIKERRLKFKAFVASMLIFILVLSVPMVPWAVRNYKVFDSLIIFTDNMGVALYSSYNPPEGKRFGITPDDAVTKEAGKINSETERNKFLLLKAKEYIVTHKREVIRQIPLKILFFWSPFDWETLGNGAGVWNFSTGFILPFGIYGLFMLRKRMREILPLILPILYFFAIAIFFQGLPRYRLAIEPFIILFAAFCMVRMYENFSKTKTLILAASWFLLNLAMFMNSDHALQYGRSAVKALGLW